MNKDDDIDRLNDFFFTKLDVGKKYPELAKVIIIILTLSHRQADIERGFSRNKTVLQQTLRRIPFVVKELSKTTFLQINFNLILLRLQMK